MVQAADLGDSDDGTDTPPIMGQDDEAEEEPEGGGGDDEEAAGGGGAKVIPQKGAPGLRGKPSAGQAVAGLEPP